MGHLYSDGDHILATSKQIFRIVDQVTFFPGQSSKIRGECWYTPSMCDDSCKIEYGENIVLVLLSL